MVDQPILGSLFYIFQINEINGGNLTVISKEPGIVHIKMTHEYDEVYVIDPKYIAELPPLHSITLNGADGKQYKVAVDETGALTATAIE